jgi:acylglycerol lipase
MLRFATLLAVLLLGACAPLAVQRAGLPPQGFQGPRFEADWVVSFDGARLGLSRWEAKEEPWAVVVALHGMNDYANAFHLAAPGWAERGITTYAYDQRGFGRSPERGIWGGEDLMTEDLRTVAALARARHPKAVLVVLGESMGGAVAATAFASDRPPVADRLVLLAPAVWGWKTQPLPYRTLLWFAARVNGETVYRPPRWLTSRVSPSDNREELIAMGRDPLMIWGARSDTLHGLVSLMDRASEAVARAPPRTLYLYGAKDEIIPKRATYRAVEKLPAQVRSAYYANGWHLLTRDRQRAAVIADIEAFIRDPDAPLPSGAPAILARALPTRDESSRVDKKVSQY